jgi:hypothetical protein
MQNEEGLYRCAEFRTTGRKHQKNLRFHSKYIINIENSIHPELLLHHQQKMCVFRVNLVPRPIASNHTNILTSCLQYSQYSRLGILFCSTIFGSHRLLRNKVLTEAQEVNRRPDASQSRHGKVENPKWPLASTSTVTE